MKGKLYIYTIIPIIALYIGYSYVKNVEGFTLTKEQIFSWATGEFILMPMILDIIIVGPILFTLSRVYNSLEATAAGEIGAV